MLELIQSLGSQPPWLIAWQLIVGGGWVILIPFFLLIFNKGWLIWRQNLFFAKQKFILLAIDIPKEHEQSPKAVEQMFASLWGIYKGMNLKERYRDGKFVLQFSFEIVSIEGYIQFLVYLPEQYRDLLEAAIYAQYPDSEIVEVEDYTSNIPKTFPDPEWNLWGSEVKFSKPNVYPIRTYPAFEHTMTQQFADPLAGILELFSRLGPGEQIWLQFVISPIPDDWNAAAQKEAKKLAGISNGQKPNFLFRWFAPLFELIADIFKQGLGGEAGSISSDQSQKSDLYSKMFSITPGERKVIEDIQLKSSKTGFKTKIRFIYSGDKEVFSIPRGVSGMFGALKQFSSLDTNSFRPDSKTQTKADYYFVKKRIAYKQNKLLRGFRSRSMSAGGGKGALILNIEELASVWHFPTELVKAPQVKRAETKMVEPPTDLPTERIFQEVEREPQVTLEPELVIPQPSREKEQTNSKPAPPPQSDVNPPENLPFE